MLARRLFKRIGVLLTASGVASAGLKTLFGRRRCASWLASTRPLQGLTAVVTGATRGIGRGIAIGLAESGATVYITGRTLKGGKDTLGSLEEVQQTIKDKGGECIALQCDSADDRQLEQLFKRVERENGGLDVLVNNAFTIPQPVSDWMGKPFWQSPAKLWDVINGVGLRSHFVASALASPLLLQRKGLIVNVSSWGGVRYIFHVIYGIGKAGMDRMAADMAEELKPHNVTVVSLWPGKVRTENFYKLLQENDPLTKGVLDPYLSESPLYSGRAVAALASLPPHKRLKRTGSVQVTAELASEFNFNDEDGTRPPSFRSLRFLLPSGVKALKGKEQLVPDIRIPWWLIKTQASPKFS
ncbi:unnamed protein product [Vitrella brassicaformis CCMP3155]|uniref:Dehydrogenase/reductase SDR family member 1 n=1 Tax=Vitrella brassicaformis (strain CCMP3155) TaxID=1169540 RepID=A0A0G4EUE8_VITBC|nr:unnamed protein product [Vitrella brassicaformis CCMP3155]|mmetsp:Transcript_33479/g.82922  ORF Transcript_33479/g.82922 Transcript_33479/m.82922 type:complete len:356 (-) Transcript_33479:1381-2448(-)|eukprot:CEM02274.1 unnamed protein product [Vitrella brassicaformis CCMP3155]